VIYTQHEGSGLNISYSEALDMEVSELLWWGNKLNSIREAEIERIKNSR
jgi:hypothetical protein